MPKLPKVSIIIPFFNSEKFLSEAIESVLSQTYSTWELILVDDGSIDGSTAIAQGYAAKDPSRIRYVEHHAHEHKGMPTSRNLGIAHSSGEYIAHLDSDDIWSKTLLEEQVKILNHYPTVAMTFGPMKIWTNWGRSESTRHDRVQRFTFRVNQVLPPPQFVPLLLSEKNDPAGYLIRRAVIEEVGRYEDSLEMCEDWALYIKIALKHNIFVSGNCNYSYRQHPAQSCNALRISGTFYAQFIPFFEWLNGYLKKVQCNDRKVLRAVKNLITRNRLKRIKESVLHAGRKGIDRFLSKAHQVA